MNRFASSSGNDEALGLTVFENCGAMLRFEIFEVFPKDMHASRYRVIL